MSQHRGTMRSTRRRRGVALVVLLAAFAGCETTQTDVSPPVAKVGDRVLTVQDLDLMLQNSVTDEATPEARWEAAERWLNRELLYREAIRRGIDQRPEVVLQLSTAIRELLINAMLDEMFHDELSVSDEEIQKYYDEHRTLFRRTETTIRVRQIVLESSTEARHVRSALTRRTNPDSFEETARTKSNDPSAADGGDLGFISERTVFSPEIWRVLQRLSEGEISQPIRSEGSYFILRVEDRRVEGSAKSLEEVKLEIINRVRSTKRWTLITELVEKLKLQEPYAIYEDRLGPRYAPAQRVPSAVESVDE